MIKKELNKREMVNAKGGSGTILATDIADITETYGHLGVFSIMHLEPGVSLGYHDHVENKEFYYILKGNPTVNDNGVECVMHPGDVMVTGDGAAHSVVNNTDEPVEFLAVIVNK